MFTIYIIFFSHFNYKWFIIYQYKSMDDILLNKKKITVLKLLFFWELLRFERDIEKELLTSTL